MYYEVRHSVAGRLRIRCGKWVFSEEEGWGISAYLCEIDGVVDVQSRPANGSILICYQGNILEDVFVALDSLEEDNLPVAQIDESSGMSALDNHFQLQLAQAVGWRILRRLMLPVPLRNVIIVARGMRYLVAGLRCLAAGKIKVEVLDATAIGAALLRREFSMASEVMFMLHIGEILAEYTQARTRCALRNNLALYAAAAWVVREGIEVEVPVDQVNLGEDICIRTGSLIPLDGVVVSGEAAVNEASMTGEAALIHKAQGDSVYAGTVVDDGFITVRTTAEPGESRIDAIVSMVENSEELKATAQSHAEKLADSMVPFSLGLFVLELLLTRNINKAISVLMVDYSCAIKLATPIAVMSAMRESVKHGVVAKGGKYLETYATANAIVFDKTGTLTSAQPHVERVLCFNGIPEDELLRMSACLEEHFPHSMARAIVKSAHDAGLHHKEEAHAEVDYIVAHGIASTVEGHQVRIGSEHFIFEDEGVERVEGVREAVDRLAPASSVVFVAMDGKLVGALCISDPLRPEAQSVVRALRDVGFERIVMLTGDSVNCAEAVADKLELDDFRAQVLPEDKASYVEDLKAQGYTVAMVGDGINDSPALAAADVSITLSDASDIARSVADLSVMHTRLDALVDMRDLSRGLMHRIDSSHRFIIGFNTALIVLGAVGVLQPALSATLHNASTVILSAANTRRYIDEGGDRCEEA